MKTSFLFATALASVMLLGSCSNDDTEVSQALADSALDKATYIDTPVEIRLGTESASVSTRAAFDDDSQDINMGVFCLARDKQDINYTAQEIRWFDNQVEWLYAKTFCVMNNVKSLKSGTNVTWVQDTTYYYPFTQFYSYDFYAYYPFVEYGDNASGNSIDTTQVGKVYVHYTNLDGKTDIVWGRETSGEPYAYSAKYFRQPSHYTETPQIQLDHMLTRLRFWIVPGEDSEGSGTYNSAQGLTITGIKVKDVYQNVTLLVADQELDHGNTVGSKGVGTDEPSRLTLTNTERRTLPLYGPNGALMAEATVPADPSTPVQLGESFLLYPEQTYTIEVAMKRGDVVYQQDHPLTLSLLNGTFKQGKVYDITLVLNGPKSITVKSSFTPWEDPGLTPEEQDYLNQEY